MGRYNTQDDFWNQVDKTDTCWNWIGAKNIDGYGCFAMNKQWMHTHRWSVKFDGRDPAGKVVMHSCDNPACVNPDHLTLGTQADNVKDMHNKGRYVKPKSKLAESDIEEIRKPGMSLSQVAKKYNISIPYASNIRNYKRFVK